MAAASLDRPGMTDVLLRWGYVDPDAILAQVTETGRWEDKSHGRLILQEFPGWFIMYVR